MLVDCRTVLGISLFLIASLTNDAEAAVIHRARAVRVLRESAPVKTKLADGTKFERYEEKGEDLPPLPIEEEEDAENLNDPRIGHLDKDGGIAVPVDENGQVLKGFEYLLKPITIEIDIDEKEIKENAEIYKIPNTPQNVEQKDYNPYSSNTVLSPKTEFVPEEQENAGDEYENGSSEPRELAPNVPALPNRDYIDSGESYEDLKTEDREDVGERDTVEGKSDDLDRKAEVIIPSVNIELPISRDEVDEKNKSADEVELESETLNQEDFEKSVDISKNRDRESTETEVVKPRDDEFEREAETRDVESIGDEDTTKFTEENAAELGKPFGKYVYEHVIKKAEEFDDIELADSDSDNAVDLNAISVQAESPSEPENPVKVIDGLDGVILPDQTLSDDEIAEIVKESLKPVEPLEPVHPVKPAVQPRIPPFKSGQIGKGVQPDSASQHSILFQLSLVFLAVLFI